MFFYVYLDPEVFDVATEEGTFAMQSLIGILRGFVQNCFIAEFEDYRVQEAIKEKVNKIVDDNDRKAIKELLKIMKKRNRFIYCLIPDYAGEKSDLEKVYEQAAASYIDILLLKSAPLGTGIPSEIKTATLLNYQHTNFENGRASYACNGVTLKEGEIYEDAFLDQNFKKALRYASTIEICDKLYGPYFSANFIYSTKNLFEWLEKILFAPEKCKIVFHCQKPEGKTDSFMKDQIGGFKRGRITGIDVVLQFYELLNENNCLPHDRYILTDQIAVDFGRGMDFLNQLTHQNRDITININDLNQVSSLLESYRAGRLSPVII
ncbi:MAG: hypothetical protein HZA08_12620 [Nitrospirae bacterium]|nr:hypothetical protein [Nitrospirota bacterium]